MTEPDLRPTVRPGQAQPLPLPAVPPTVPPPAVTPPAVKRPTSTQPAVPPPAGHGGDGARVAAALGLDPDEVLDLSATLNPLAPDPAPVLRRHLGSLHRYPDPSSAAASLASHLRVEPELLVLTNGGAEAIALVAAELGGRVDEPDFSLYPREDRADAPRWRSNPHSPSGRLAAAEDEADVWDEAFWPMATGTWTRGDHRRGRVVVGSLTKLLAVPGLRVGYALCPDADLARRLRERQPTWSVNGLVASALPELLDPVDLPTWAGAMTGLRDRLVDGLVAAGLAPVAADAPWVLVPHAAGLRDRLARRGVVVRDCSSFGLTDTVRIAVPGDEDRCRLLEALEAP
jgi:histidinol-phosphate/aromatic aminotransferase/cobyric acid decarboxylase-like protein